MFREFALLHLPMSDLFIILIIILLLFGAKKLPELSRSLSTSARELRKGIDEDNEKDDSETGADQR
jgi:sec-independent protein translocase protein TatA